MVRLLACLSFSAVACGEAPVSSAPGWRLSENPTLTIGTEGVAETEFHRVAGVVHLGNGEIAVADGGTSQVRFFSPQGGYLRSFGGQGSGPGEFQSMGRLIRFGDIAVGILPAAGEGDMLWLGWFPGPWISSIEGKIVGLAGFFTWVNSAVAGGEVIVLDGYQERLRRFSPDGTESPASAAFAVQGEPVTPEIIEAAKRQEIDPRQDSAIARQWLDVKYAAEVLPHRLPPFRGLLSDSEGLLWMEGYRVETNKPGRYFVFTVDATHLATVPVPAGFRALEIGLDYLLGVGTDADGVERVVTYGLTRN